MSFFRPRKREMYFVISIVLLWSQVESIKIYVSPNATHNEFCWSHPRSRQPQNDLPY